MPNISSLLKNRKLSRAAFLQREDSAYYGLCLEERAHDCVPFIRSIHAACKILTDIYYH